ncbi:hypothetical protein [Isorropodon fossajaponicum symbiont]|uniref:hypothetical protein n=1 Tax=Isorropodon fossajaponicum symbiont TaxID=883811 RepID=UPI0019157278|nr:hypothetical protein [Isorropodon fossajaponicum symbiont]
MEIYTGEFKYNNKTKELSEQDYFTGGIVLTTIDQIINGITTHRNISTLTRFMNATVVFDEFHEYVPMAGFNILEDESNPLYQQVDKNTFVISNTATTVQKSFIDNQEKENGLLTHAKFTLNDRKNVFKKSLIVLNKMAHITLMFYVVVRYKV